MSTRFTSRSQQAGLLIGNLGSIGHKQWQDCATITSSEARAKSAKELAWGAFIKTEAAVLNFQRERKIKHRTVIAKRRKMELFAKKISQKMKNIKRMTRQSY